MPLYAVIRHRGRRSGRVYATPVAVTRRGDALVVPLPFSSSADWCRNVVAAGECVVRWNGREHRMIAPEILGEEGRREFNGLERWALPRLGIASFLRLRFATAP
jgi:deazaflavin-dependent oxidoreductase (nitroreductase family)